MSATDKAIKLEPEHREKIRQIRSRYPENNAQAALLPVLHKMQDLFGYISPEIMQLVSEELGVPYADIREVVTFYTMFYEKSVGKYNIQICHNISCTLMGAESLISYLEKKLGLKSGQTTADGRFSLMRVECLGACDGSPMMLMNDRYYLNLTPEKLDDILDNLPE